VQNGVVPVLCPNNSAQASLLPKEMEKNKEEKEEQVME
jgi:hypothetical protein